jgi:DNA modification methylase
MITDRPLVHRPVGALQPYSRNARTHSAEQVAQIVASMQAFGFTNPLLVDEADRVIAGHGRLEAALALGLAEVPCIVVAGLTEAELLTSELAELRELGVADLTGFDAGELLDLLGGAGGAADPDDAPPLPAEPFSRLGDVWTLGAHRLLVGDACSAESYDRLLGGELVDAVWTDPPYNVAYEGTAGSIANDDMGADEFLAFLRAAFSLTAGVLKPGGAIYVAHADTEGHAFRRAFVDAGLKLSGVIVWCKDSLVLGRSDYQWQHEPILYGWRPGSRHRWYGGRKLTTVQKVGDGSPFAQAADGSWVVRDGDRCLVIEGDVRVREVVPSVMHQAKPKRNDVHPTMKPVELIARMRKNSARPGDLVLDAFGGSGSTLIAADQLGMSARLMELDPRFADVIVQRWQTFTGRRAVRDDGVEYPR